MERETNVDQDFSVIGGLFIESELEVLKHEELRVPPEVWVTKEFNDILLFFCNSL